MMIFTRNIWRVFSVMRVQTIDVNFLQEQLKTDEQVKQRNVMQLLFVRTTNLQPLTRH